MTRDLQELSETDRATVEAFRKKRMGIDTTSSGKGDRDTWVCDDMTINASKSDLPLVLAILLLGFGAWWLYNHQQPYPGPPDSAYDVLFYDEHGNPIDVPRLPLNLRK